MRHIAPTFLESTLERGASLEQFMGGSLNDGERSVRWIELRPSNTGVELWEYVVPDLGAECLDLYALAPVELEPLAVALDAGQALALAQSKLGASPLHWVNQGVSQDEFFDFLQAERPAPWPRAGA
jgi:hypothetical protein